MPEQTDQYRIQGLGISELAEEFGTPLYVYDGDLLRDRLTALRTALHPGLEIVYSLKSNPNVAICAQLHEHGAGAEVSSMAELLTSRWAGVDPQDIVFLGPGKSAAEITACLDMKIHALICESVQELALIDRLAGERGISAPVALRVNPNFQVKGSGLTMGGKPRQFGIDENELAGGAALGPQYPNVRFIGVQVYMGTRILDEATIAHNTEEIFALADRLAARHGFDLELVDIGGGLGVAYFEGERDLDVAVLAEQLNPVLDAFAQAHPRTRLLMELGRYLTAPTGTYVTRVRYTKTSFGERFAVADGGTNHHMAAVGLGSFVKRNFPMALLSRADGTGPGSGETESWQVTGPLCTPNDTIGRNVALPPLRPGDLVGVLRSGAYGPTASPVFFLSHGYPAEVLVLDGRAHLIREPDRPEELLVKQRLPVSGGQTD